MKHNCKLILLFALALVFIACGGGKQKEPEFVQTEAGNAMVELQVSGMTCKGCEATIRKVVSGLDGVDSVKVTLADSSAIVYLNPEKASAKPIFEAIEKLGYSARLKN